MGTLVSIGWDTNLARSTDLGNSWGAAVTHGLGELVPERMVGNGATGGSGVWLLTSGSTLRRSATDASSWSGVTSGYGAEGCIEAVATNGAGTWLMVGRNDSGGSLLRRSTNNGSSWSSLTFSDPGGTATDMAFGNGAWLMALDNATLRSTNNGTNWTSVLTPVGATTAAVATDGAGVWMHAALRTVEGVKSVLVSKSTDNGATWAESAVFPTSTTYDYDLFVATNGHGTFCVLFGGGQLRRTTDSGATWHASFIAEPTGAESPRSLVGVGGTWFAVISGTFGIRYYRSTDNGRNWSLHTPPSVSGGAYKLAHTLAAIDPAKPVAPDPNPGINEFPDDGGPIDPDPDPVPDLRRTMVVGGTQGRAFVTRRTADGVSLGTSLHSPVAGLTASDTIVRSAGNGQGSWLLGTTNGKVCRSTDDGATWAALTHSFGATTVNAVASDGWSVWLVALNGPGASNLWRSTDNGDTWTMVGTGLSATDSVQSIATDGAGDWLCVDYGGELYKSTDNGATWIPVTYSFPSPPPTSPGVSRILSRGVGKWAIFSGSRVYSTADNGTTWTAASVGIPRGALGVATDGYDTYVAVGQHGAVSRSVDGGMLWHPVNADFLMANLYAVSSFGSGRWVVVGADQRRWESLDNGLTWSGFQYSGPPANHVFFSASAPLPAILAEPLLAPPPDPVVGPPTSPHIWVAGSSNGTLRRSIDNGSVWTEVTLPAWSGAIRGVSTDGLGRWVVCGDGGQLCRSIDNGLTWASVNSKRSVSIRAVASGSAGVWLATGAVGELLRSADHGQTWNAVNLNIPLVSSRSFKAVASDGAGVWVAVVSGLPHRIVRSDDNGVTWSLLNQSFEYSDINGLQSVSTNKAGVWMITGHLGGVFWSVDNGLTWTLRYIADYDLSYESYRLITTSCAGQGGKFLSAGEQLGRLHTSPTNDFNFAGKLWYTTAYEQEVESPDVAALSSATDGNAVWMMGGDQGYLSRSTDNANSWTLWYAGFDTSVLALAQGVYATELPVDPPPDEEPEPEPEPDPIYWFAVGDNGKVRRSIDNGLNFAAVDSGGYGAANVFTVAANGAGVVITGGEGGVARRSSDNGTTWVAVDIGFGTENVQAIAVGLLNIWVAVSGHGRISRSTDGGVTWALLPNSLGLIDPLITLTTNRDGVWLAGDGFGTIIRSVDNGVTWAEINASFGGQPVTTLVSLGSGVWLAAGSNGVVRRSTDNGLTWVSITASGDFYLGGAANGDTVFLVGWNGVVLRSLDAGLTWGFRDALVGITWMLCAAASPTGRWLLGGQSGVMALTPDNGDGWTTASAGFAPDQINAVAFGSGALTPGGSDMNIESLALGDDALTFRARVLVESLGSTADALTFGGSVLLEMLSSLRSSVSVDFTTTLLVNMHDLIEVQADQTVASVIGVTILSKLYAHGLPDTEIPSEVWVLNAETMGATRYEGFEFNSYAKIGNSYYGCAADGLYLLEGDTDAGDPVQAMVSFGKQDFGTTTLKRISNAYVGLRSDGKLFLKVTAEGSDYLYAARDYDENLKVQRFDTGKGLCANYIEFELYNEDGNDFELASVEFAAVPVSRRI